MIPGPQQPARAERAFPPALLILGWLLLWTWPVRAHDPGLSALTLRIGAAEISASLVISTSETAAVPARSPVRLRCDGRELTAPPRSMLVTTNGQDVVWNFSFPRLVGNEWEIHATALATLPRGHRQFVKVLDARDQTLATALLSAEQPSLKFAAPGGADATPRFVMPQQKWLWLSGVSVVAVMLILCPRRSRSPRPA